MLQPAPDLFAVAQLVLDVALVDLSHADRVKSLIKDLWDIRFGTKTIFNYEVLGKDTRNKQRMAPKPSNFLGSA